MSINNTINNEQHLPPTCVKNVPDSFTIFGSEVNVNELRHGKLTDLAEGKVSSEMLISRSKAMTEFLMWISSYCFACIYQKILRESKCFHI